MADWKNNPQSTTPHESVLKELRDKDDYALTLGQTGTVFTNLPVGAMFWDESGKLFRRWNGSQKEVSSIGVAGGGTGASDALGARANIGADDAANLTKGRVKNARLTGSYDIDTTGNSATSTLAADASDSALLEGNNAAFYRNASNLNAGLVPSARLSGSYNISIAGNAATATNANNATTANNALLLEGSNAAFYSDASNLNAGTVAVARLPSAGGGVRGIIYENQQDISLDGDFTGDIRVYRVGNTVTVTNTSDITFLSAKTFNATSTGFLPGFAVPQGSGESSSEDRDSGVRVPAMNRYLIFGVSKSTGQFSITILDSNFSNSIPPSAPYNLPIISFINLTYTI